METTGVPALDKVNQILEDYVSGIGVNLVIDGYDVSPYFNYSADEIKALDCEDCDTAAGVLLQKSIKLQLEINRHTRTKNWATESIKAYIVGQLSDFDKFMPYDTRKELATQNNEYTQKLAQAIRTAQAHIDTLQYIPTSLKHQADFFTNLARSKRKTA